MVFNGNLVDGEHDISMEYQLNLLDDRILLHFLAHFFAWQTIHAQLLFLKILIKLMR